MHIICTTQHWPPFSYLLMPGLEVHRHVLAQVMVKFCQVQAVACQQLHLFHHLQNLRSTALAQLGWLLSCQQLREVPGQGSKHYNHYWHTTPAVLVIMAATVVTSNSYKHSGSGVRYHHKLLPLSKAVPTQAPCLPLSGVHISSGGSTHTALLERVEWILCLINSLLLLTDLSHVNFITVLLLLPSPNDVFTLTALLKFLTACPLPLPCPAALTFYPSASPCCLNPSGKS